MKLIKVNDFRWVNVEKVTALNLNESSYCENYLLLDNGLEISINDEYLDKVKRFFGVEK
jgi:hypothetical protein